ncbi:MAG: cold shock domain protein CspD, partial [Gammaproteobacteria bacterium HGW-Gammaproteobacteria-9]
KAGQAVMFNILQGPKGLHATDIRPQQAMSEATAPAAQGVSTVDA